MHLRLHVELSEPEPWPSPGHVKDHLEPKLLLFVQGPTFRFNKHRVVWIDGKTEQRTAYCGIALLCISVADDGCIAGLTSQTLLMILSQARLIKFSSKL